MASETYAIIRDAISKKKQIFAKYEGYDREMCPHCIGLNNSGGEQALFFQFAGGSKSGLPPEGAWRCIPIAKLINVVSKTGPWHTTAGQHTKPQTCVKEVDLEVAY